MQIKVKKKKKERDVNKILNIGVILQLLSKRRIKVKTSSIQSFFTFVQDHCPWFLQQGTVN